MMPKVAVRYASIWMKIMTLINYPVGGVNMSATLPLPQRINTKINEAATAITFELILMYVPPMDCVAFKALLEQMFHFAGITSSPVISHIFSNVIYVNGTEMKK